MNKSQLIRLISWRTGSSQKDIKDILEAMEDIIGESLAQDEKVVIAGFGRFHTSMWGDYFNRQTGKYIHLRRVIRFRPGSRLKAKSGCKTS